ncbi:MAG: hypothetical protein JSR44_02580 [Spirochaetes bacterium]|nr:hypothetical protein [Spirochaetota bacterium]
MQQYRVKILIAMQRDGAFVHRNEFLHPEAFNLLDDALKFCADDIEVKIANGNYFRSQIYGFDLVCYRNLCSQNQYIAYRVAIHTVNRSLIDKDFEALTYI